METTLKEKIYHALMILVLEHNDYLEDQKINMSKDYVRIIEVSNKDYMSDILRFWNKFDINHHFVVLEIEVNHIQGREYQIILR